MDVHPILCASGVLTVLKRFAILGVTNCTGWMTIDRLAILVDTHNSHAPRLHGDAWLLHNVVVECSWCTGDRGAFRRSATLGGADSRAVALCDAQRRLVAQARAPCLARCISAVNLQHFKHLRVPTRVATTRPT